MIKRYDELDSLRGIASLMVLLGHFMFIFPSFGEQAQNKLGMLSYGIWNGHSAVILFFVLSGFVLSLPIYNGKKLNYKEYIIKRVCRIYIPYIIAVLIAIGIKLLLRSRLGTIPHVVSWGQWNGKISLNIILNHILFIGQYNSDSFVMVIWSLAHEMRISIVFPFIVLILLKIDWKISVVVSLLLSFIGFYLENDIPTQFHSPISTNYFITIHYVTIFILGALIAKYRNAIIGKLSSSKIKHLLLPIGIICFFYPGIAYKPVSMIVKSVNTVTYQLIIDWIIAIGGICLIVISLSSKKVSKILLFKPIRFLGKVSYSLYLTHPTVLLTCVYCLYWTLPIPYILMIAFCISLFIAYLSYRFIENPSIKLGKILTRKTTNETQIKYSA